MKDGETRQKEMLISHKRPSTEPEQLNIPKWPEKARKNSSNKIYWWCQDAQVIKARAYSDEFQNLNRCCV